MSYNWNTRTELLLGADRMERLAHSHVLVVGLGGVGAYAAEQICRAGIGHMTIVDADTVNESNINRQLPALHSTLGMPKAEVVARRLLDINPRLKLGVLNEFCATNGRKRYFRRPGTILSSTRSIPSVRKYSSCITLIREISLSFPQWVPEPRWTRHKSGSRISRRPATAHWQKPYANDCAVWASTKGFRLSSLPR